LAEGWPEETPSTKAAVAILKALQLPAGGVLVVTEEHDGVLYRSLRNVPRVEVRRLADLNALDVLRRRHMVLTPGALAKLEEQMAASPAKRHGPREES
jgi:large subunit ribosomal protein L4